MNEEYKFDAAEAVKLATAAERRAAEATDEDDRAVWLTIAADWRHIAAFASQFAAKSDRLEAVNNAFHAEARAAQARTAADRELWLKTAESWRKIAKMAESSEKTGPLKH